MSDLLEDGYQRWHIPEGPTCVWWDEESEEIPDAVIMASNADGGLMLCVELPQGDGSSRRLYLRAGCEHPDAAFDFGVEHGAKITRQAAVDALLLAGKERGK